MDQFQGHLSHQKEWSVIEKFGTTVLIGKNKLVFPMNVIQMFKKSPYIRTLLEATDNRDFTTVNFLADYEIDYDNKAFSLTWSICNLSSAFDEIFSDYRIFNGNFPERVRSESLTEFLLEFRTFADYFGLDLDVIDHKIWHWSVGCNGHVPAEFKDQVSKLNSLHQERKIKISFIRRVKQIVNTYAGNPLYGERALYDRFAILFTYKYAVKELPIIEKYFPDFKTLFYDTVVSVNANKNIYRSMENRWLADNSELRHRPRAKYSYNRWIEIANSK